MDYLPYPIFNKMQKLGRRDKAKIESIYSSGTFGTWSGEEMPCSDAETLTNPLCNPQDVGDPVFYYANILDSFGAFHEIQPVGGGLSLITKPTPVVDILSKYLMPSQHVSTLQKWFVETKLCENTEVDKITEHFENSTNLIMFHCPEKSKSVPRPFN